jgi:HSP20 family protein
MNRMFERLFDNSLVSSLGDQWNTAFPRIDVKETAKDIRIMADLPGLDEKDITVTIEDGRLTLRGEKREDHEEQDENYYWRERSYGTFHRQIQLPGEVEPDKIEAVFKRGVLSITVPRKPEIEGKTKRIEIKAG